MTTKQPPLYPGAPHPDEIIGPVLLTDFTKHYVLVKDCRSQEEFSKAVNGIPAGIRAKIEGAYIRLRASGWWPNGVDEHKQAIWLYQLDSRLPEIRENEGRVYTHEEANLARASINRRGNVAAAECVKTTENAIFYRNDTD